MSQKDLIKKYDVPAPRYTSYPTVPYWEGGLDSSRWIDELTQSFAESTMSWSMYLHIPFCETLCTFCGCNTSITKDHSKEEGYIATIHQEWNLYLKAIDNLIRRPLREIHLGGGTPTFLSPENLENLLKPLLGQVQADPKGLECSIEVDPRRTTREHLTSLKKLGFTRVSMGVQDFEPEVQRLVNRIQPLEMTADLTQCARDLGFKSVNFDLIYGLPKQTAASIKKTASLTVGLRPDRIALYSYAHVPWIKPAQRLFTEADLPVGDEKRALYEIARDILIAAGYVEIGMDHFALKTDSLYKSFVNSELHRNFMGYTDRRTNVLLGLGVSAISETLNCFHQNEKVLPVYSRKIASGEMATFRGHLLTSDDKRVREQILQLMTRGETKIQRDQSPEILETLAPMIADGFIEINEDTVKLTQSGRPFLRNACMAFDRRLRAKQSQTKIFSQSL